MSRADGKITEEGARLIYGDPALTAAQQKTLQNLLDVANKATVTAATLGTPILRKGLIAEYTMDEGSGLNLLNSSKPHIPYGNLFPNAHRLTGWSTISGTLTASYAVDPFGFNNAGRFSAPSGTAAFLYTPITIPATGNHVVSAFIRSNNGAAQTLRIRCASTYSSDITIPAAGWTRVFFTASFTAATNQNFGIASDVANTALDIVVACPSLTPGTVPTAWVEESGELANTASAAPFTWSQGGAYFPPSSAAKGNLPRVSTKNLSVYIAFRWTTSEAEAGYASVIQSGTNGANWSVGPKTANNPGAYFGINGNNALAGLSNLYDNTWHIMAVTYDGTNRTIEIDGFLAAVATFAQPIEIITEALEISSTSFGLRGDIGYCSAYAFTHDAATRKAQRLAITNLMARRGIVVPIGPAAVLEGHSKMVGVSTALAAGAVKPCMFRNYAVSGDTIGSMTGRMALTKAVLTSYPGRKILIVWIGHNNFSAATAAAVVAELKTYCLDMLTVANELILCTETPSTTSGINAKRNAFNTLVRADPSFYTRLADLAADPVIGPDAAAADTNLYADGVHLTVFANTTYVTPIISAQLALAIAG